jgi:hypothetical protein
LEIRKRWGVLRRGWREWESAVWKGIPVEAFWTIELRKGRGDVSFWIGDGGVFLCVALTYRSMVVTIGAIKMAALAAEQASIPSLRPILLIRSNLPLLTDGVGIDSAADVMVE